MCCFSGRVAHVGGTQIFARHLGGGRQALAYSMNVELEAETAMVLPLPVRRADEGALAFVDLSSYSGFFADLDRAFPREKLFRSPFLAARQNPQAKLAVHQVGAFVASFAPSRADLDRLDERFRIAPALFDAHPAYGDWGFAVFQLAPRRRRWWQRRHGGPQTIHPMALSFESREPGALFYPTVHVHDGTVPAHAVFDHTLYAQVTGDGLGRTLAWETTDGPASRWVAPARAQGLVDGELPLRRHRYGGRLRNIDLWVRPAAAARPMAASGDCWRWRLSAPSAHGMELREASPGPRTRTMQTRLDAIHDAFAEGVPALVRAHELDWGLGPLDGAREFHRWVLGPEGATDRLGAAPGERTPSWLRIRIEHERADAQEVRIGFVAIPSAATMAAIERELGALLARAVA
jgi:hypothetical protein